MKFRILAISVLFLSAAIAGNAQNAMGGAIASPGPAGIKNKPYSADTVTISDRVLADGNRIHVETHGKIFRDSEGRERREDGFPPRGSTQPQSMILINDPTLRAWITLQQSNRTAIVNYMPDPETLLAKATKSLETQPSPKSSVDDRSKIETKREDLGVQDIEGIEAQGYRITRTFPAGFEGNEQPITVVAETWRSADLGIVVLSKNTDPRSGTSEHRLVNVQRSEPDPTLFQIPTDYTVRESKPPQ